MPAVLPHRPELLRVLVTGFEPFAGADDNPSARLVASLADSDQPPGVEVIGHVLPVSASRLPGRLLGLLDSLRPDVVLGLGEARGSAAVRVERVAVNLLDFATPDNDGDVLRDMPVVPGGPPAYFTTLPAADVVAAVRAAGVPCDASLSAGAYLCNQMMYLTLHWAARQARGPAVGFVHVPSLPSQNTSAGGCPAMDLPTQQRALSAVLGFIARRGPASVSHSA
jgi:pyroglutamyl-peptidase